MEEKNNNVEKGGKMKTFKIFKEAELDEAKSTMYGIVKGNQEKGKVVFKGSKRTALKKLRANEFGPNTILINSPSAKVGDKWGKGKTEEVEIEEGSENLVVLIQDITKKIIAALKRNDQRTVDGLYKNLGKVLK